MKPEGSLSPPSVPILSQINPVHVPIQFIEYQFSYYTPTMPGYSKWPPSLNFPHQNSEWTSPRSHACYMPCQSHSSSYICLYMYDKVLSCRTRNFLRIFIIRFELQINYTNTDKNKIHLLINVCVHFSCKISCKPINLFWREIVPTDMQGRIEERASRAAARGANLKGALRRQWNNRKYGAAKLRFPHAEEVLLNCTKFGHMPSKKFASPALGRQSLKNVGLTCRHINTPAHMSWAGPADRQYFPLCVHFILMLLRAA